MTLFQTGKLKPKLQAEGEFLCRTKFGLIQIGSLWKWEQTVQKAKTQHEKLDVIFHLNLKAAYVCLVFVQV